MAPWVSRWPARDPSYRRSVSQPRRPGGGHRTKGHRSHCNAGSLKVGTSQGGWWPDRLVDFGPRYRDSLIRVVACALVTSPGPRAG